MNQHPLFENVLTFAAQRPLRVHGLDKQANFGDPQALNRHNEQLLKVILSVNDQPHELDDVHDPVKQELQRVEQKLDLLLMWVGRLVLQSQGKFENYPVRLSAEAIEMQSDESLTIGQAAEIEVVLTDYCPQPLIFIAKVIHVRERNFVLQFEQVSEQVADLLDKFIFREHRRSIAQRKKTDN